MTSDTDSDHALIFWTKIGFIVFCFCQAFFAGLIPLVFSTCRESPKVLGFAQAFASGIFLAICLIHILPEQSDVWTKKSVEKNGPDAKIFPLAEMITFIGYVVILVLDKVLFDSHALFEQNDNHASSDPAN